MGSDLRTLTLKLAKPEPKWRQVFSQDFADAKTYKGKCTHEDTAFLVDPTKIFGDWQAWARNVLPQEIIAQYESQGAIALRLRVYVGTEPVLLGLVQYPAIRVESWHHGSPAITLVLVLVIGVVIVVWAFLAWLFQKAEEIDWLGPAIGLGAGALVVILLLGALGKRRED